MGLVVDNVTSDDEANVGHPKNGRALSIRVSSLHNLEFVAFEHEVVILEYFGQYGYWNLSGK
jgi:hypothetical protein